MIKKIKYLFLLFICAGIFGGLSNISAQSKSDVAGMIEFYEWAFETEFSAAQRAEFARLLQQDFRNDQAKARKDTNNVLETFAKIKEASAEARRETRRIFLEGFLPNLKKNESSDAGAKFLLTVFRDSHNGRDEFTAMDAASGDVFDKRSGKPANYDGTANLIGKWSRGTGSGYVDPSGKTKYKSGDTYSFEFFADGTIEYVFESDVLSIVQCRTKENSSARGKYTVSGDSLTINLAAGTSIGTSSCSKNGNFKKTVPAAMITKKFVVKRMESSLRPDKPLILCFDGQKDEDCFERGTSANKN